jgi:hypothetical protein
LATNSYGHVVPAIENVLPHLNAGDVLLIEWQTNGLLPAETDFLVWEKICQATSLGIVVIEAAGNGFKDLDTVPMFSDSGAILVGACVSALDATGQAHDRLPLSNFGARVDCHAFGQNIVTTGPGNPPLGVLDPGTGPNNEYRKDFGATSGAAAVVAGAAVVLQGMHKGVKGGPLTSIQLRNVFRTTGTNQGTGVAGNIGRMPDLKAAAASLGLIPSVPAAPNNLRIVS